MAILVVQRLLTCSSSLLIAACTLTTDLDGFVGNGGADGGQSDAVGPPVTVTSPASGGESVPSAGASESTATVPVSPSTPAQGGTSLADAGVSVGTDEGSGTLSDASMSPDEVNDDSDASSSETATSDETLTENDTSSTDIAGTASDESPDTTGGASDSSDGPATSDTTATDSSQGAVDTDEQSAPWDAGPECPSTHLFADGFEGADLAAWTSATIGTAECQQTQVSSTRSLTGNSSLRSEISCALEGDAGAQGHQHFVGLQFSGDTVVDTLTVNGTGIDAPDGVVISFGVWIDDVEVLGDGRWLSLLLLSGSCDWSDSIFSLGIEDDTHRLAIAHAEVDGGSVVYAPNAPAVRSGEWTQVTAFINYHEQVFHVWQDGTLVVSAEFVRPGQTLCHVIMGTLASENNDELVVFHDEARVWRLEAPLTDPSVAPCAPQ